MLSKWLKQYFKLSHLRKKRVNNSGIILLTVLWALVILTILAVGMGRSTHVDLSLTKYAVGKIKAKYLAWAGVMYAIDQIRLDSQGEESKNQDTLYYCAIPVEDGGSPQNVFQAQVLGEGHFDVQYQRKDFDGGSKKVFPGIQDEERRININAVSLSNIEILQSLIVLLGTDEQTAEIIAHSILDWKDANDVVAHESYGAENIYYNELSVPYNCKNRPFDLKSELLLVRGMSKEIYQRLKEYITVFPKKGSLKVNFDTASRLVLQALARAVSGAKTNTIEADADSLVEKLLDYRRGEDHQEFTEDDRLIDAGQLELNTSEKVVFLAMSRYRTKKSNYLNIQVKAAEKARGIESHVEAVVHRYDLSIVYWRRD